MRSGLDLWRFNIMPSLVLGCVLASMMIWGTLGYLPWGNWAVDAGVIGAWAVVETVAWRRRRKRA